MKNKITSLILFIIALISFICLPLTLKIADYTERKNQIDCEKNNTTIQNSECGVWSDNQCRKGKINGNACEAKSSPYGVILLVLGVIFFILSIYFFFKKD